jgi:hydrogenase/urease accessory protein HupE
MTLAEVIYLLCALTSVVAAVMLLRQYQRRKSRLLLWSSIAFVGLAVNNVLMYIDLLVVPEVDLSLIRSAIGAAAMVALVYGLVTETST